MLYFKICVFEISPVFPFSNQNKNIDAMDRAGLRDSSTVPLGTRADSADSMRI
jgi:hypothetical protein